MVGGGAAVIYNTNADVLFIVYRRQFNVSALKQSEIVSYSNSYFLYDVLLALNMRTSRVPTQLEYRHNWKTESRVLNTVAKYIQPYFAKRQQT